MFSPEEIEGKEFLVGLRGYLPAEVRPFLRAVAEDVRRLLSEVDGHPSSDGLGPSLSDFGAQVAAILEYARERGEAARHRAEAAATSVVQSAREESASITDMARKEAASITALAREEAGSITAMAREDAASLAALAQEEAGSITALAREDAESLRRAATEEAVAQRADVDQRVNALREVLLALLRGVQTTVSKLDRVAVGPSASPAEGDGEARRRTNDGSTPHLDTSFTTVAPIQSAATDIDLREAQPGEVTQPRSPRVEPSGPSSPSRDDA